MPGARGVTGERAGLRGARQQGPAKRHGTLGCAGCPAEAARTKTTLCLVLGKERLGRTRRAAPPRRLPYKYPRLSSPKPI